MAQSINDIREQEVVKAFIEFLKRTKQGNFILHNNRPDRIERELKAPDFLATDDSTNKRIAIEITSLYKSCEAGLEDSIWMETVGGLDLELRGKITGSIWLFIPELTKSMAGLKKRKDRLSIRSKLVQVLPKIANSMPISDRPKRFTEKDIPFPFEIRKRKADGSWVAISRLSQTSQPIDDVLDYLRKVLPGKNEKFCHPEFVSDEHVLLIDNRVPFIEQNLIDNAFLTLSNDISMELVNRIFIIEFDRVNELKNPWGRK